MISVREALECVLREARRLGAEQVAITQARGRVLADPIRSVRDVPAFRNAAMDGYAVRAVDVGAARADNPVRLVVRETVGAGAAPSLAVGEGSAARIMTGAVMPDGADAVVKVEDTEATEGDVYIRVAARAGLNVRGAGEDVRAGELVLSPGRLLRPADIGLLASLGHAMVRVSRRPEVAILATGDELVDVGQPLRAGQVVNSNAYTLAAAVEEAGGRPAVIGIVRDSRDLVRAAFAEAFDADVVLSTGGVSAGDFDYVRGVLAELDYDERFWQVAQKPGKPLAFGVRGKTPVFGLPGNPVSSLVCFYVYVLPALRTMMGLDGVHLPTVPALMAEAVAKASGLTEFIRCVLEGTPGDYRVRSTGTQSSAVLRSLSLGDGLILGPPEATVLGAGERVRVLLLAPDAGSPVAPC